MFFARILVWCEKQTTSSSIWTQIINSISNDNNHEFEFFQEISLYFLIHGDSLLRIIGPSKLG